jgi:hypothetical protein
MEQTTSFIPKKSVIEERPQESSVGLFTAFSIIMFLMSILTTVGMFLWHKTTETNLVKTKQNFEQLKNRFQPELISELKRMDDRLNIAGGLMTTHVTPSKFLRFLQTITYKDVMFTSISYGYQEKDLKISLKGQAKTYSAIALQSDAFKTNKYIKEYLFSNLSPEANGNISFEVSMNVDPAYVLSDNEETN